jgi:hypothetical protein
MAIFELELSFSADLTRFLRRDSRDQGLIRRMLAEKTAVPTSAASKRLINSWRSTPIADIQEAVGPVEVHMLPACRVRSLDRVGPW